MKKTATQSMTEGAIASHLVKFAIPMVLANICQLTYNATDSIIVGRYLGKEAFAAVGAATPVMTVVISLIVGICLGISILMSEFYGAGLYDKLRRQVSTSIIAGFIFTLALVVVGVIGSRGILWLLRTPAEILDEATLYLQIIFVGLIFTFGYNVYAAALRSMGNSKVPLYFLFTSAVLNIVMDLFFILYLRMGVLGVALATITAEAISAVLCYLYVLRFIPELNIAPREWHIDHELLRRTVSYSSVAAMQQSCNTLGKMFIQGPINALGIDAIAAFNAVNKIDDFVIIPEQNIAHAATTFLAQNRGAAKFARMVRGFLIAVRIELYYGLLLTLAIVLLARPLMVLFVGDGEPEIIEMGVHYFYVMALFYFIPGLTNIVQGFFRGMGFMRITLNSTFVQISGRVIAVYVLAPHLGIISVAIACFIGWLGMFGYELPKFFREWRKLKVKSTSESV